MKIVLSQVRDFLIPRKKAVAAFLAPIVVAQVARFIPGVHIEVSLVEQLIAAAITGLTVHQTTNVTG